MTYETFQQQFHIHLNEQQESAVRSVDGPILLLAVPGSGKTTVLISRLGYMIYGKNIPPEQILTVTYTVAATKDMKCRFLDKFGPEYAKRLEFRTINGLSQKILQYFGQITGKNAFDLAGREINGIIQRVFLKVRNQYATENDIKEIQTGITYAKNMRLSQEELQQMDQNIDCFSEIFQMYNQSLRELRLIDYDDQMVYALQILQQYPNVLEYFQDKYQYICVDEAQDTSKIQHDMIRLLAGKTKNLFMVGDEDQSIYGFRAAYPQALVSFEQVYPGANVLLMETNYRSRSEIVEVADHFIQSNRNRHPKQMNPARKSGGPVEQIRTGSRKDQYDYLLKMAQSCSRETAVLYRNHESALPLIDLLERNQVPYRLRQSDMTFFSHPVVGDIRDFMELALDPSSEEAFLRIYYKMGAGITKLAAEAAVVQCRHVKEQHSQKLPKTDLLGIIILQQGVSEYLQKKCRILQMNFSRMKDEPASKAVSRILLNMGYAEYMDSRNMDTGKAEILKILGEHEPGLRDFLLRLDQLKEIMSAGQSGMDSQLVLSTIHSSKGLEYERVFLADMLEGVLPGKKEPNPATASEKERNEYEEERRLFYVGMTRAKEWLGIFSFADGRTSCFTKEALNRKAGMPSSERDRLREEFDIGVIVVHKKFGRGAVAELNGDIARIAFENGTQRQISLSIAISNRIMKIEE